MLKFSAFIYVVKTSLYNGVLCPSSLYQCFRSSCFFGKMLSLPFSEKSYTVVVEQLITTGTEEERNETAEIKKHTELKTVEKTKAETVSER